MEVEVSAAAALETTIVAKSEPIKRPARWFIPISDELPAALAGCAGQLTKAISCSAWLRATSAAKPFGPREDTRNCDAVPDSPFNRRRVACWRPVLEEVLEDHANSIVCSNSGCSPLCKTKACTQSQ